jgi:hypothetical protein
MELTLKVEESRSDGQAVVSCNYASGKDRFNHYCLRKIQKAATEYTNFTELIMLKSVQSVKSVAMFMCHFPFRCHITHEPSGKSDAARGIL